MTNNSFCMLMTHYSKDLWQLCGLSQSKTNFLHSVPLKPTYTLWVGPPWGRERPIFRVGPRSQKGKEKVTGSKTKTSRRIFMWMLVCCYHMEIWDVKKVIPHTGLDRPRGYRMLRLPEVPDNRHMKAARLSALSTGHLYPRRYLWYSSFRS